MPYLQPAEYTTFGLSAETSDAWITAAGAMIDAHCRRPTLLVASYTERMRLPTQPTSNAQSVRLSYTPLISVDAVKVKQARPDASLYQDPFAAAITTAFATPNQWTTLDPTTLDVSLPTAEFSFAQSFFGQRYAEAEVTYTAGFPAGPDAIPDAIKVATAQIVRNAQATPGLNVRSSKLDTLQTQYFSDSLLDQQVRAILRPYVAERLG